MDSDVLKRVLEFATKAHGAQMRKYANEPYIRHPQRVMNTCMAVTNDEAILAAALLHDVLEDTPVTQSELMAFLESVMPPDQASATGAMVVELTDIYTKPDYPRLNRRRRKEMEAKRLGEASAGAQTVKYADIIDNSDVTWNDAGFAERYLKEARQVLENMQVGDAGLRRRAIDRVDECMAFLQKNHRPLATR